MATNSPSGKRFESPLYTVSEAALYLGIPRETFRSWAWGRGNSSSLVTAFHPERPSDASVPFIGIAEGLVLAILRRYKPYKVKMRYIREVLSELEKDIGLAHALASKHFYLSGGDLLYNYAGSSSPVAEYAEILTKNQVFETVVAPWFHRITWASDEYPEKMVLPSTERPIMEVDAERAFGRPLFIASGARVQDVLARFKAGDAPEAVAYDFGVPLNDLLDVLRAEVLEAA